MDLLDDEAAREGIFSRNVNISLVAKGSDLIVDAQNGSEVPNCRRQKFLLISLWSY